MSDDIAVRILTDRELSTAAMARALAIVVGTLALAAPAQAAWAPPHTLSRPERSIDGLRLAGGSGRRLASWRFFDRKRAGGALASRVPDRRWRTQRTIGSRTLLATVIVSASPWSAVRNSCAAPRELWSRWRRDSPAAGRQPGCGARI